MTDQQDMNQFMDEIDKSMTKLEKGAILKGTVMTVGEEDVIVNIGHMSDGIITKNELTSESGKEPSQIVSEGDEIDVYVLKADDGEGNVVLSKKRADQVVVWDELAEAFENGKTMDITVKETVKGGAVAFVKGVRAFIPASQLSVAYVEDLESFVGQELNVKIIELNKEKKNVVLSRREVEQGELKEKRAKLWDTLLPGDTMKGEVKRLEKFGAFIDIGGLDGLAHISQLSWKRVKHPSEVVSIGDQVDVEILSVDKEKNRLSLKVLNVQDNPWDNINAYHNVNDVVEGTVVRVADFGAFVALESGVEGLVHVSEISNEHIKHPKDALQAGQKVEVRILDIKPGDQRMSLSIKAVDDDSAAVEQAVEEFAQEGDATATLGDVLSDKLKDFFKE
ncbi:30S ribosomal protein S1 [Fusibacter sp. JL216-2]|uniref:30S ribosomal protein S1 n=1 Tax=Fusibacter sp. JL216-2 TaxID=3071453 RepID=UPI003D345A99